MFDQDERPNAGDGLSQVVRIAQNQTNLACKEAVQLTYRSVVQPRCTSEIFIHCSSWRKLQMTLAFGVMLIPCEKSTHLIVTLYMSWMFMLQYLYTGILTVLFLILLIIAMVFLTYPYGWCTFDDCHHSVLSCPKYF